MLPTVLLLSLFSLSLQDKTEHRFRKIPSFLKTCKRSDPELNECVKESVEHLREHLVKGIPEFGIPPCEPLLVPEVVINQGKGPVSLKSTYSNVHVTGASQFSIKSLKIEPDRDRVRLRLWLPFLHMISDYELDGQILMLPISGVGVCEGNFTDIEARVLMEGEKFEKRGANYFNVNHFDVKLIIGHASVQLDDLFKGDQELGNAMNVFLNENWQKIVDEMKPVLENTIGDMFKTFSNNIYHKYSLDQLLPSN